MVKGSRTVATLALSFVFFAGLPCVDGACTLPSSLDGMFWSSYTATDQVIVMEFSSTTVLWKNLDTGIILDTYNCQDLLPTPPYVLILIDSPDGTTQYCLDLVPEGNTVLMQMETTTSTFKAAAQCRDVFDNNNDPFIVMVQYDNVTDDFLIDQAICPGDLIIADYTLTYFETTGSEVCAFDLSSTAVIGDQTNVNQTNVITLFSCTNANTYYQPFRTTFTCLTTYRNNITGGSGQDAGVLILSAIFNGKRRFYCSHYAINDADRSLQFSLAALDQTQSQCATDSTSTRAEITNTTTNAGYKHFVFHSLQCLALIPCLHGGTCTHKIGSYECACRDGYEGMDCETDIDECASLPCQNGGTCNDLMAGYECLCKKGFVGTHCETGLCIYPSSFHNSYWSGYTASDEVIVTEFSPFNVTRKNLATGATLDVYNCQGGFVMSPYVYVLMADSKDTTKQYCLVLVAERNILLMRLFETNSTFAFTDQCQDSFDTSTNPFNVLVQYDETADDFLIDQASCPGDLIVADYTLTYFETTGSEVCAFDFSSSAAIGTQDHAITVFSCTDVATYYQPFRASFTCLATYRNNITGVSGDDSDVLILSAIFNGKRRFYCSHYAINDADWSLHFSLAALDQTQSQCATDSTSTRAEITNTTTNAGYKHFAFHSLQCLALIPCLYGGTCTQKIGSYECACRDGYEGMDCETDIDECASLPCQNGGTCNDLVAGYECRCKKGFVGTHCETGLCIYPSSFHNSYWSGYTASDEVIVTEFSPFNVTRKNLATGATLDVYNCQGGFVMSPYVYVLMADSKDTTKQYCLVLVAERNILLMLLFKTNSTFAFADQCQDSFDTSTNPFNVLVQYDETADDFLIDQASCPGDLIVADYTLTYFETTGSEVCAFDFSSSAAIGTQDHAITVFSCTDVATYYQPFRASFTCLATYRNNITGVSGDDSDFLILTAIFNGKRRFYCSRYSMNYADQKLHFSLAALDQTQSQCPTDFTSTRAEITNATTNAGYKHFVFHSLQCVVLSPCLYGGTCTQKIGSYECACRNGFEGMDCEREGLECASEPCQNGGTCLERSNGYYCRCTEGWILPHCEHACARNPCGYYGACSSKDDGFVCTCESGSYGNTCESRDYVYETSINLVNEQQTVGFEVKETIKRNNRRRPVKVIEIEWEKIQSMP